ncbi:MAG: hypothetical protein NZ853_02695 [Leptospiraceae bacterium]|nr:hypothetical protein [Leptospiraceae bacterium]MDW7975087.1 CHASE4 domain-containing protein [Leptospiraceae bacterium]
MQLFVSINPDNSIRDILFFDNHGSSIQVPESIKVFFQSGSLKHIEKSNIKKEGFIKIQDYIFMVVARPVSLLEEDYKNVYGTLVFGRLMDNQEIKILSDYFDLEISIHSIEELRVIPEKDIFLRSNSLTSGEGILILRYLDNQLVAFLSLKFDQRLLKLFTKVMVIVFILVVIMFLLAFYFMRKAIQKQITNRVSSMEKQIQQIQNEPQRINQFPIDQEKDEINDLQRSFKDLFLKLIEYEALNRNLIESIIKFIYEHIKDLNGFMERLISNTNQRATSFQEVASMVEEFNSSIQWVFNLLNDLNKRISEVNELKERLNHVLQNIKNSID